MAIKTEDLTTIEKALKLEEGTLSKAIENEEEVAIELTEDLVIRTKEEEDSFTNNIKTEAKTAGVEMAIKGVRNDMGLDFEGKTMDNLLGAYKDKVLIDAKDELGEPDKKISELNTDLEKVRGNLATRDEEITTLKTQMQNSNDNNFIDSQLLALMPDNLTLSKSDALTLFKSKHVIELGENKALVFKKDGEVMKNETTRDPLPSKDIINSFSTPFLKKAEGGGGGGNDPGDPKGGTMAAFEKEMTDKDINVGSEKFNSELNKRIKDKTLVV